MWEEVRRLVNECPWFRVYDIIEEVDQHLIENDPSSTLQYEEGINSYFREAGIGWQLSEGRIPVSQTIFDEISHDLMTRRKDT